MDEQTSICTTVHAWKFGVKCAVEKVLREGSTYWEGGSTVGILYLVTLKDFHRRGC